MQRHLFYAMACALGGVAIALLPTMQAHLMEATPGTPKSLAEAVDISDDLGLFHRFEGVPTTRCLLVSENEPLPDGPRLHNPSHPSWIGTVAIYGDGERMVLNYDPNCSVHWGSLFIYGDPQLIEKLTGHRP
jgi:hypothetical protein